jgi:hypothetical protein
VAVEVEDEVGEGEEAAGMGKTIESASTRSQNTMNDSRDTTTKSLGFLTRRERIFGTH